MIEVYILSLLGIGFIVGWISGFLTCQINKALKKSRAKPEGS